jgi:hypothetical protein
MYVCTGRYNHCNVITATTLQCGMYNIHINKFIIIILFIYRSSDENIVSTYKIRILYIILYYIAK